MKKLMARLMTIFVIFFLVLGLLIPAFAQPEAEAPAPPAPPPARESPDSQRYQPVTPGQRIKLNSERVKRYQAVPPPEESPPPGKTKPSGSGEKAKPGPASQ